MTRRRRGRARGAGCLALGLLLLVVVAVGWWGLRSLSTAPLPALERCVATAGGRSVAVDLEQARSASVIAGVAVRRGLAPRAASIALATAYQETDLRNLDYGDRDSVGLFQQRPSQGWGTVEQLLDPHYATGEFYDALVRVPGWRTRPVTEVAQAVQRSAYPDAYADHEADARVLASALTGESAAAVTCLDRSPADGDAEGLRDALRTTFGRRVAVTVEEGRLAVEAPDAARGWAYAHAAVVRGGEHGVTAVTFRDRRWTASREALPAWAGTDAPGSDELVSVGLA